MIDKLIIDGSEAIFGRIASFAAKQALLGKKVVILNCNHIHITGRREMILEKFRSLRAKGGSGLKGPKIPKIPERIMKRAIRGMLSHKQWRGKNALKRVMCYNLVPQEYADSEKKSLKKDINTKSITLEELVKFI